MLVQDVMDWLEANKGRRISAFLFVAKSLAMRASIAIRKSYSEGGEYKYPDKFNRDLESYNAGMTSPLGHRDDLFKDRR